MFQTLVTVAIFVALLAALPFGVKWIQRRTVPGGMANTAASRVVSAVAVGPHQRVVTVEVGPDSNKTWLVLGVTAQTITCLHSCGSVASMSAKAEVATTDAHAV